MNLLQELSAMNEMAKRSTPADFYKAAVQMYGAEKVKALKWPEIMAIAQKNDVQIPAYLRTQKVGRGQFNLVPPGHEEQKSDDEAAKSGAAKLTLDDVKKLVPDLDKETSGDDLYWQVTEWKGEIRVSWDYTFKRDTHYGAYKHNEHRIEAANNRIESIAAKYPKNIVKKFIVTAEHAKSADKHREDDGDSAYSEYEQSIGGGITLKP